MDLHRLSIFLAIVDTGSMRAATRQVHLTQPALSRAIQHLEDDLSVALFERTHRRMTLTAAGRALAGEARRLVDQARASRLTVMRAGTRGVYDLRLGAVDSVAIALLPTVLPRLRRKWPGLHVKISTDRSAALLDELAQGRLDLAIVASTGRPRGFDGLEVAPYRLGYYGRKDRFPHLARATTLRDLRRFPLVEISPPPGAPAPVGDDLPSFARVSTSASVKALVLCGFGVGDLLDFMLDAGERRSLVRARVPHDPACRLFLARSPVLAADATIEAELRRSLRAALAGRHA